jgi:RNA polymerase sigma-70 factor (ECF subfamily)
MIDSDKRADEFVRLFTGSARWVFSYILTLVHIKADAEEIFQETNTTLWQKFDEFVPGTSFRNWAAQVAYFKVLQYRERQRRSPVLFDDALLESIHGTATKMAGQLDEVHWALEKCREKLPDADRELLRQRYESGASTESVASRLGRSSRTVYRALDRIHQSLYDCIRGELSAEDQR